jgi:hypothetical protein
MVGNTKYEEITCVGFNPSLDMLEATVQIKLPYGYGGSLCGAGTTEYVRFFVDYGTGWEDVGLVAFNIHDIPNITDCAGKPDKPLTYAVTQRIEPKRSFCGNPMLPMARAILSWEAEPVAGDPDWPMVWGNVLERHIQIAPRPADLAEVLEMAGAAVEKLPPQFKAVLGDPVPQPEPEPLALAELVKRREYRKVEPHRFGLSNMQAALATTAFNPQAVLAKIAEWQVLELDWQLAVETLDETQGNVSYEELDCLGLDYNRECLVAIFHIKRPSGYSGDLCDDGSLEHVAFWADWDNTCEWSYLATVQVNVHDIPSIPPEGLHYAAILPVDLDPHRQTCEKPKIGRVRAVLSWSTAPSTTNPDALPHWGNRLDAHVQIRPGKSVDPTDPKPIIGILGGIPISKIDPISGLTTPDAFFALNGIAPDALGRPCPFARRVVLQGPSFPGFKYRVQVRKVGDAGWSTVTTEMELVDWTGTVFTPQAPNAAGFFTFVPFNLNVDNVLAWWGTSGDDLWEIKLELATMADVLIPGAATHRIQLDNTAPEVDIHIASGGDCKDFTSGVTIGGDFVARDDYFGRFTLHTSPFAAPPGQLSPTSGNVQTALPPGNPWTLDTDDMDPCGYVVVVRAVDRAIINSVRVGHWNSAPVGFCLRA